jgi:vancomycin aglycone glucosyltransferase
VRVLLSTYDSRGGVEPLVGLVVRLRELGAEVRVCAPPDCAERLAEVGVPLVPVGPPVRPLVHGATPPSAADVPRLTAELIATAVAGAIRTDGATVAATLLLDEVSRERPASARVSLAGSPSQDPEHQNLQAQAT